VVLFVAFDSSPSLFKGAWALTTCSLGRQDETIQQKENPALFMATPLPMPASSLLFHYLKPPQTLLIPAVHIQKLFLPPYTPPPLSPPPAAWENQTFFLLGRKKGVLSGWKGKQRNGLKGLKLEFYGYFYLSFVSALNFSFFKNQEDRNGKGEERREREGGGKKSPQIFMCDTAQGGETYGWFA